MNEGYAKRHRQLRVFISSTFADMNAERDALVLVFPQIKGLCEKRGVSFVPLDLRWGITENAAQQGRVLDTCMREIDQSRPFFIGLVGNRYGWVPTSCDIGDFDESLQGKYPWLRSALADGMSITEMEMQYAVLRSDIRRDKHTNAAFYLRSSRMQVPPEFCEPQGSASSKKLELLRNKIREQHDFPVRDYDSPQQLAEQVMKDLTQFLDSEFPAKEVSSCDIDAALQENILESRSPSLFDLSRYDNDFCSWFASVDSNWLSVTGYSGRGKSYLLSRIVSQIRAQANNPAVVYCDQQSMDNVEAVLEFVTVELLAILGVKTRHQSERSNMLGCLGSFVVGLFKMMFKSLLFGIQWALGNQQAAEENLRGSYQDYLQNIVSYSWRKPLQDLAKRLRKQPDRPLFVALDNLDVLTSQDLALLNILVQLPHIRYICTSSIGTKAQIHLANTIKAKELKVENLYVSQSQAFITNYLAQYSKNLDEQGVQRDRLVHSSIGGNPRLLSHVLNLMVCFGSFEEIDNYINTLAAVKNSQQVYEVLIQNIQKLFSADEGGRAATEVLMALSLIPDGIQEEELKEMLNLKPLEWAMVRPYVLDLCTHRGRNLMLPSHDHFQAVGATLSDKKEDVAKKISAYFENLLEVSLKHNDFLGNPDLGKINEDANRLNRQVQVLPNLYMEMQWTDRLYEWCTYLAADARMTETQRFGYWRTLFQHGYCMRKAPNHNIPPYLKHSINGYAFFILLSGNQDQNYQNYIQNIYKDEPLCATDKELQEMYQRWMQVAGVCHQQEDFQWLSKKTTRYLEADDDFNVRIQAQNQAQQLLAEKRYDDLIALSQQFRVDDVHQVMIDYFIALAYENKQDFDHAFQFLQTAFNGLNRHGCTYLPEMILLLCEYACIASYQNRTDAMNTILPILEQHRQQQQQNGIDNISMVTLFHTLATLYHALGKQDEALRSARLWLEACKNMKLPVEMASQFIAQIETKSLEEEEEE